MTDEPSREELDALHAASEQRDEVGARRRDRFKVTWDDSRKPPKPVLPPTPAHHDMPSMCTWVTNVLNLDDQRPVIGAEHQGLSGSIGHVVLKRLDAPEIRFEPASKINSAQKLGEELVWQLVASDGDPYPWANAQAQKIATVIRRLCGANKQQTTAEEAEHIVATYIGAATPEEGYSHGNAAQRVELASLLKNSGPAYGIDKDTGELLIRISDLQHMARELAGTLPYGWLDGRLAALGWTRVRLEGHRSGGGNHRGQHVRVDVYRGHLGVENGN